MHLKNTEMSYAMIPLSTNTVVCSDRDGIHTVSRSAGNQMAPAALRGKIESPRQSPLSRNPGLRIKLHWPSGKVAQDELNSSQEV